VKEWQPLLGSHTLKLYKMISLRKLIQLPGSPDIALKQQWKEAEAAHARIAHVNRLSRDVYDIVTYELDLAGSTSIVVPIESKKGILDIENADGLATSLYIYLKNDEITADRTKFYIQLSVYTTNSAVTPIAIGRGISTDEFLIEIKNLDSAAAWTNLYLYYELVKID
jgi:hypothetical protein